MPRRPSVRISSENSSSSTARARISAPSNMDTMRIESPRAVRFDSFSVLDANTI